MLKVQFDVQNSKEQKEKLILKVNSHQKKLDLAYAINSKAKEGSSVFVKDKKVILLQENMKILDLGKIPIKSHPMLIKDFQNKANQPCRILISDISFSDIETSTKSSARKQQRTVDEVELLLIKIDKWCNLFATMNKIKSAGDIRKDVCDILGEKVSAINSYQKELEMAKQFYYDMRFHQTAKIGHLQNYNKEIFSVINKFFVQNRQTIQEIQINDFMREIRNKIRNNHQFCCLNGFFLFNENIEFIGIIEASNKQIIKLLKKEYDQNQPQNSIQSLSNLQQFIKTDLNINISPLSTIINEVTLDNQNQDDEEVFQSIILTQPQIENDKNNQMNSFQYEEMKYKQYSNNANELLDFSQNNE